MAPKLCAKCGHTTLAPFENISVPLFNGELVTGLFGVRCEKCSEVHLDAVSHDLYVQASDAAVLVKREQDQMMLARVRKKLKLTQIEAAHLTGGGHNAFSRYERGEARPLPAVLNLFKILDNHPDLIREIR